MTADATIIGGRYRLITPIEPTEFGGSGRVLTIGSTREYALEIVYPPARLRAPTAVVAAVFEGLLARDELVAAGCLGPRTTAGMPELPTRAGERESFYLVGSGALVSYLGEALVGALPAPSEPRAELEQARVWATAPWLDPRVDVTELDAASHEMRWLRCGLERDDIVVLGLDDRDPVGSGLSRVAERLLACVHCDSGSDLDIVEAYDIAAPGITVAILVAAEHVTDALGRELADLSRRGRGRDIRIVLGATGALAAPGVSDSDERSATAPLEEAGLIGRSASLRELRARAQRVGGLGIPIVVRGEGGSGRRDVARHLHTARGGGGEFVEVACARVGAAFLEAELFGDETGTFPAAGLDRIGAFERAGPGTVVLRDVDRAPASIQLALARVLESGTFRPVGGPPRSLRARIVALLEGNAEIQEPLLRFRMAGYELRVPPLDERPEDIGDLARSILTRIAPTRPLSASAESALVTATWPGQLVQLERVLELASATSNGRTIEVEHLAPFLEHRGGEPSVSARGAGESARRGLTRNEVESALSACAGHRGRAAHTLGVTERTLYRYLKRFSLV